MLYLTHLCHLLHQTYEITNLLIKYTQSHHIKERVCLAYKIQLHYLLGQKYDISILLIETQQSDSC